MKLKELFKRKKTKYERHRERYNIGEHSYMSDYVFISRPNELKIGKFCSIGYNVCLGPSQHSIDTLSTHPFQHVKSDPALYGNLTTPDEYIIENKANNNPITIGNDVFIGHGVIIKDGVTIGDGAVIGSGAVVTKDVEPYAVMVGVPAKLLKYRFEKHIRERLLELKWWDYPDDFIVRLPFDNVEKCIELLENNKHLKDSIR